MAAIDYDWGADGVPVAPVPSLRWLAIESLAMVDIGRFLLGIPRLVGAPRGSGKPIFVIPGFRAGDWSTIILRTYLNMLGHRSMGWGRGMNHGHVEALMPSLVEQVTTLAESTGSRVRLVGWSLGGFLAREVSRDAPDVVERVVTLASPIVGGPKYTLAAGPYRRRGYDMDEMERMVAERDEVPLSVPVTSFYSKRDGVVAWQASIDRTNEGVEHVEVSATHWSIGFIPEVLRPVAELMATPDRAV